MSVSPTEWPTVAVQIARQGAVDLAADSVLSGYARHQCSDLVAFYVDLDTKESQIAGCSSGPNSAPSIEFLPAGEAAVESPTELAFPEYVGWSVFSATLYGDELAVVLFKPATAILSVEPLHIQQARQQFSRIMATQPELLAAGLQALDLASNAFGITDQGHWKLEASRQRVAELEQIVASTKHIRNGRKNRNYKWRLQLRKLRSILVSTTASEKNKIRTLLSTIDFWLATGQARESAEPGLAAEEAASSTE